MFHKFRSVDSHLLGELVEPLLDLVLAFDASLEQLSLNFLHFVFLLALKRCLFFGVALFLGHGNLQLELLLDFLEGLVLGLGMLLQELLDLVVLLLLELF